MRRFYGVDLAGALYGPERMSPARLRALIERLPPDSAFAFDQDLWWSPQLELLATIAEAIGGVQQMLGSLHAQLAALGGKRGARNPIRENPIAIKRPKPRAAAAEHKRPATIQDYRRVLGGLG